MPPPDRDTFGSDLLAAVETSRHSIVASTRTDRDRLFASWVAFTTSLQQDAYLRNVPSNVHLEFFIIFACHYHRGLLSRSSQPVRAQRVAEALHAVGQAFTRLGLPDPRLEGTHYVFCLKTLFKAWADEDPTPSRVWPVNITIL